MLTGSHLLGIKVEWMQSGHPISQKSASLPSSVTQIPFSTTQYRWWRTGAQQTRAKASSRQKTQSSRFKENGALQMTFQFCMQ